MLLLEQDITRKKRLNRNNVKKLDASNNKGKKYKIEAIWDSVVYKKELDWGHLAKLYYLIYLKKYFREKNTWNPYLIVQYLGKLLNLFYKEHFDKLVVISEVINFA